MTTNWSHNILRKYSTSWTKIKYFCWKFFIPVTMMLSLRVVTLLSVLLSFAGLSQQKYFLIDTEAEEGSGLGQDQINSTYPTEGPAKLKLYNRAQSARITQIGEGSGYIPDNIFKGQGWGRGSGGFHGGFHGGGGGWCRCHFKGRPCSSTRGKKVRPLLC